MSHYSKLGLACLGLSVVGCGNLDQAHNEEELGYIGEGIRKGNAGAVSGQTDYCGTTVASKCIAGESDCDSDAECATGLVCGLDQGRWGYLPTYDVCQAATCNNGVKDGTETGVDCGGNCPACTPKHVDSRVMGGAGYDQPRKVIALPDGSSIVASVFQGSANYGGAALNSNAGSQDIALARYSPTGAHVWSKSFGADLNEGDFDIGLAINAAGTRVTVATNFAHTINFGGGITVTSLGSYDALLAQFDATNGNIVWAKRFGGTMLDRFEGVTVDPADNIIAVGAFQGTAAFGGANLVSAGGDDMVAAKFSSAGVYQWSRRFGGTGSDYARAVAVDRDNYVHYVGRYTDSIPFSTTTLTSAGGSDGFIAKFAGNGINLAWAKSLGGTSTDIANAVGVDAQRRAVVVGYYKVAMTVAPTTVTVPAGSADNANAYAAAFNKDGTLRWLKQVGGTGSDTGEGVAVEAVSGDVAMVGRLHSASVPAFYPDGSAATATNAFEVLITRYHATTGGTVSAQHFTGASAWSASTSAERLHVLMSVTGTANFGGSALSSSGGTDTGLVRFGF